MFNIICHISRSPASAGSPVSPATKSPRRESKVHSLSWQPLPLSASHFDYINAKHTQTQTDSRTQICPFAHCLSDTQTQIQSPRYRCVFWWWSSNPSCVCDATYPTKSKLDELNRRLRPQKTDKCSAQNYTLRKSIIDIKCIPILPVFLFV